MSEPTREPSRCPSCGSTVLCKLHGLEMKICYDCTHEFKWGLDAGQKPIFEGTSSDPDYIKEPRS